MEMAMEQVQKPSNSDYLNGFRTFMFYAKDFRIHVGEEYEKVAAQV
jgi:hypothetical protein